MAFGASPTTGNQVALAANQFPLGSVAVPGTANGDLTALEGGPASIDSNTNVTAPVSAYIKAGNDVTEGNTTDAAVQGDTAGTVSAKLRGLNKTVADVYDSTNHALKVEGTGTAGTAATGVVTVQGIASGTALPVSGTFFQATQPVSGTVSITSNSAVNLAQVAGTTTDVNSGNKSAGTQRVILATDQPQLTNALKVDGSAVTQPVSGTITANQGGTWTVQPGNTANTTAWKVDGSAATQPVSASSLPLPTGASTSAKQPALGTAGSASTDVLSVQGIASGTALNVSQQASGSVSGTLQSAATGTGTGTALSLLGNASCIFTVSGTYTGLTMAFQGTEDNTNYSTALTVTQLGTSTILTSITANGLYECSVAGLQKVQANISAIASGSVTVTAHTVPVAYNTRVVNANQAGTWTVQPGNTANTTAWKVDGSAVTQPVSLASLPALAAGAAVIGALTANQSVNHAQVAGTTTSVNSGTVDAGTQRVVQGGAATGTKSNAASSASSVTILASNTARKGAMIYNDSTQILYLDLSGGTASSTSYSTQVGANVLFELPAPTIYNGAITGIWAAANGNARVTEFS